MEDLKKLDNLLYDILQDSNQAAEKPFSMQVGGKDLREPPTYQAPQPLDARPTGFERQQEILDKYKSPHLNSIKEDANEHSSTTFR